MDRLTKSFQNKLYIKRRKPNLSDLPLEIVEQIVKETNLPTRLSLRKVCRTIRTLVDRQDPICDCIGMYITSEFIELYLEDRRIVYKTNKIKTTEDIINTMFTDLLTFISHPKFFVKTLKMEFTDDVSLDIFDQRCAHYLPFSIGTRIVQIQYFRGQERKWNLLVKRSLLHFIEFNIIQHRIQHYENEEFVKLTKTEFYSVKHGDFSITKSYPKGTPIEALGLFKRVKKTQNSVRKPWDNNFSKHHLRNKK